MSCKLRDYFGKRLLISGKATSNILTLRELADDILRKYYSKPKYVDTEIQKQYIIEAAAKILKNDIKTSISESFKEHYPSPDKFSVAESVLFTFYPPVAM